MEDENPIYPQPELNETINPVWTIKTLDHEYIHILSAIQ
jgi:hypothetical protein